MTTGRNKLPLINMQRTALRYAGNSPSTLTGFERLYKNFCLHRCWTCQLSISRPTV